MKSESVVQTELIRSLEKLKHEILFKNKTMLPDIVSVSQGAEIGKTFFFECKGSKFDLDNAIGQCLRYFHAGKNGFKLRYTLHGVVNHYEKVTQIEPIRMIGLVFPRKAERKQRLEEIIQHCKLPIYPIPSTSIEVISEVVKKMEYSPCIIKEELKPREYQFA